MEGSDESDVGAPERTIVEDERGHRQSAQLPLGCGLLEDRDAEIEVLVVFAENDLVVITFEHPEDVYPVSALGLEICRFLQAEGPHETVSRPEEQGDPFGLPRENMLGERLCVAGDGPS